MTITSVTSRHFREDAVRSRTYISWVMMKQRCTNSKATSFADYGGRGIRVCRRWRESFENFRADMGERRPA